MTGKPRKQEILDIDAAMSLVVSWEWEHAVPWNKLT
jgi:hypothetical protein